MAKSKTNSFFCKECGFESAKWLGCCPACRQWNTFVEAPKQVTASGKTVSRKGSLRPVTLSEVKDAGSERILTGLGELDRVLGGGIVPGSLVLLGGDPGIGKSTLLLQACYRLSEQGERVLYVSGEESLSQLKMRAERMNCVSGSMLFLSETDLESIEETVIESEPRVLVIDSIQTMYREQVDSAPGSMSQVREATYTLMRLAKDRGICIFLIGHVTKEGVVAGPRMLEHMVDTVLYFEGERSAMYRVIRAVKNRFGATNEIGVFEMVENGLSEVPNPSRYLLEGRPEGESGSAVTCLMEGSRPVLLEIQALVSRTNFGMPRRTAAGMDHNRVSLLMAVLEKRAKIKLSDCDCYVNVAGGIRVSDPSLDLALVAAIWSSAAGAALDSRTVFFGEVGLSGEVRSISQAAVRISEAAKMGFEEAVVSSSSLKGLKNIPGIRVKGISHISELGSMIKMS